MSIGSKLREKNAAWRERSEAALEERRNALCATPQAPAPQSPPLSDRPAFISSGHQWSPQPLLSFPPGTACPRSGGDWKKHQHGIGELRDAIRNKEPFTLHPPPAALYPSNKAFYFPPTEVRALRGGTRKLDPSDVFKGEQLSLVGCAGSRFSEEMVNAWLDGVLATSTATGAGSEGGGTGMERVLSTTSSAGGKGSDGGRAGGEGVLTGSDSGEAGRGGITSATSGAGGAATDDRRAGGQSSRVAGASGADEPAAASVDDAGKGTVGSSSPWVRVLRLALVEGAILSLLRLPLLASMRLTVPAAQRDSFYVCFGDTSESRPPACLCWYSQPMPVPIPQPLCLHQLPAQRDSLCTRFGDTGESLHPLWLLQIFASLTSAFSVCPCCGHESVLSLCASPSTPLTC
jgi:hypothetical protein